jgi:O-glycosyl hydrolase
MRARTNRLFGTLYGVVVGLSSAYGAAPDKPLSVQVRIDGAKQLQQIDGFGSGAFGGFTLFDRGNCDWEFPKDVTYKTTREQREAMVTTAVRELGVTHLRMWIAPPSIEPVNDNDDPAVMAWDKFQWEGSPTVPPSEQPRFNRSYGLKEWGGVLAVGVPLGLKNWIITPGGLPDWLDHKLRDDHDPHRFDEYAEWAAAHVLYLKKTFGVEAPYWSMYNEPDNVGFKDPAFWTAWIKATGRRFRKEGLATRIMAPDYMNVYAAVPLTRSILADEEARSCIGALAYHHYRSSFDDPKPFLDITSQPATADAGKLYDRLTRGAREMAELGRRYGLPAWQTETAYYPAPLKQKKLTPWDIARGRANEIHYELLSGASAVAGMLMIWIDAIDPRYEFTVRLTGHHIVMDTDGKNVTGWAVTKDCGAIFAHYGRFVRPGDHRVAAESDNPLVRVTAFSTGSGRRVAVLVNNTAVPAGVLLNLDTAAAKSSFAGGLLSDETHTLAAHPVRRMGEAADRFECTLTPWSVCTIVWSPQQEELTLPGGVTFR